METEELTRLVDGIYKNILDKFNPGARQLINAGKAYLKALHGAAAASRVYVDALSRLARQAQLGTWGGSQDIGSALMRIVEVYKEIQEQEMNILKAFYVDLLVPLETNLEKDTKVVQSEQKKFLQQHKTRSETYSKAAATIKKQRKKSRGTSKSGLAMDKELKNMQILEEEKSKLDAFCEQSLKNAMTQERRRYGFVLERQCSLAKHYASFHEVALAALHPSVDDWREVANTREYLPQSVEDMFASRLRQVSFWPEDEENYSSELTINSQLRKTRSMDSSCLELRLNPTSPNTQPPVSLRSGTASNISSVLHRARSEANLHASSLSLGPEVPETPPRPRSMAPISQNNVGETGTIDKTLNKGNTGVSSSNVWGESSLARALFAYLSSGENQLSFLEGDLIALMGDRQKGWQFGENLRTQSSGWFPLAYTEIIIDESSRSPSHRSNNGRSPEPKALPPCKPPPSRPPPNIEDANNDPNQNTNNNNNITNINHNNTLTNVPKSLSSHNVAIHTGRQPKPIRPSGTLPSLLSGGRRVQPPIPPVPPPQGVTSLHSSNDSGFSNEPPAQPDIDYSDDEAMRQRRRKTRGNHLEPTERVKHQQQQQQQHQHQQNQRKQNQQCHDIDEVKGQDWTNDSWKTIPRDDKSWQMYRTAMDLWSELKHQRADKRNLEGKYNMLMNDQRTSDISNSNSQSKDYSCNSNTPDVRNKRENKCTDAKRKTGSSQRHPKDEIKRENRYNNANDYVRKHKNSKRDQQNVEESEEEEKIIVFTSSDEEHNERSNHHINNGNIHTDDREVNDDDDDDEDDDDENDEDDIIDDDIDEDEDDDDTYYNNNHNSNNSNNKNRSNNKCNGQQKYYNDYTDNNKNSYDVNESNKSYKYDKSEMGSSSSESESTSTITIPETGRKVEHIAQKLEQTAQKYAKEHSNSSPSKFVDKRKEDGNNKIRSFEGEKKSSTSTYEKYCKQTGDKNSRLQQHQQQQQQHNESKESNKKNYQINYERERTFEKNPDRKKDNINRRFDPPKPPMEDAPERPKGVPYRVRRYSDKEEIYGELKKFTPNSMSIDKDRGYESNFETKLERNKIIEKVGYKKTDGMNDMNSDKNDSNNNSMLMNHDMKLMQHQSRQSTTLPILMSNGKMIFDSDIKSPKLIKRTKSFWRFRRDSEVLEGMALWQHRSLVDIPKMIKKEMTTNDRKFSEDNNHSGSEHSIGKESKSSDNTITNDTNEKLREEPKPAERNHITDKSNYYRDFPTPAERPKAVDREYKNREANQVPYFVGNISRKAILEKERKRSLEAKKNLIAATAAASEYKENHIKKNEYNNNNSNSNNNNGSSINGSSNNKSYGDDDDGLIQNYLETEASDEESTYSCIVEKDQQVIEKTLLPRTKLRRDNDHDKNTCGPWYDLWGVDASVKKKKK